MTQRHYELIFDWLKWARMEHEKRLRAIDDRIDLDASDAIQITQGLNRRIKELQRLEDAVSVEIDAGRAEQITAMRTSANRRATSKKKITKGGGSRGRRKKTTGETP